MTDSKSDQNLAVIGRMYDAFASRDIETIFGLLADDVQIWQTPELPWGGHFSGTDGAGEFFLALTAALDSQLVHENMYAAGDHVVQVGRTQGTVVATGVSFDVAEVHVWELRGGRAVELRSYIDTPAMLDALDRGA